MHSLKDKKIQIMIRRRTINQKNIKIPNQSVLSKMRIFKAKRKNQVGQKKMTKKVLKIQNMNPMSLQTKKLIIRKK